MKINNLFRKKSLEVILKHADNELNTENHLKRNLKLKDLTALGIAAIIGAGIFSTIGNAAVNGGPAVSMLFIFTAIACGFSAMCYAQFASSIPISGSAYTYSYASFGELIAWIIGWDLIMEYAVGNIAVAISWSDYFTALLHGLNIHIPEFFTTDYLTASRGFEVASQQILNGVSLNSLSAGLQEAYSAWINAPVFFGIKIIADIPAFSIVIFITYLVYVGIQETKVASNIMVMLKLVILIIIISVGAFYINPENWNPFAPNGLGGVLKGVSGVFFAYIGFDAISTTAEECKNPKKDLPRSMILSLIICTILYVLISLVLTGMVSYKELGVGDPLAFVFAKLNLSKLSGIIAISAVIAMASVLLVFQVGQPRIWMSMSRDGLLPKRFSKLHKKFKTPAFATVLTGIIVAVPSLFLNLTEVTDLTSIGTLFAFVLVCGGTLIIDKRKNNNHDNPNHVYRIPYYNCRYYLLPILIITLSVIFYFNKSNIIDFWSFVNFDKTIGFWDTFKHKIPFLVFTISSLILTIAALVRNYSLIPVLGLLTNFYLMTELGITNWLRFIIWLFIGLCIYFLYGNKNSKIRNEY